MKVSIDGEDPFIISDVFDGLVRQLLVELEDLSELK